MKRKGSDHSILSSVIAGYDHISLFGRRNTQLAHRELKPLSFLHCFATSSLLTHTYVSLFFIKEIKGSSQILQVSPWSLVLKSREHSIWPMSPICSMTAMDLHQISLVAPSSLFVSIPSLLPPSLCVSVSQFISSPPLSSTSWEMACSELCREQNDLLTSFTEG